MPLWQIPEIKNYVLGIDAGLDPERNHDFCIVADFADDAGFKAYSGNPDHVKVITEVIKPMLAPGGRTAVQFYFQPSSL